MIHTAGSTESSDCLIRITPSDRRRITIESIVFEQFGDAIHAVLNATLDHHGIERIHVECFDKGALDATIKSRLETALKRGGYLE
jgi:citrate lyase subunit gamma (acyl carrier protein)